MELEESRNEIALGIIKDPAGILDQISFKFLDHVSPLKLDLFSDIAARGTGSDEGLGMGELESAAFDDQVKYGTGEPFFKIFFRQDIFGKRIDKISDRMI